jgi:hypothetical protein
MPESPRHPIDGYLTEYAFIAEGLRNSQRERQGFLAFSLAANGLILGLLMRPTPPRSPIQACFLVGLAAGVTLIAERMTIRASYAVAVAGAYLRLFVEPHVEGLGFQRRMASSLRQAKGIASAARSFGLAYTSLTAAFVLAWFAAPMAGGRQWWQTLLIGLLATTSAFQVTAFSSISRFRWDGTRPWQAIHEAEQHAAGLAADPDAVSKSLRPSALSTPVATED